MRRLVWLALAALLGAGLLSSPVSSGAPAGALAAAYGAPTIWFGRWVDTCGSLDINQNAGYLFTWGPVSGRFKYFGRAVDGGISSWGDGVYAPSPANSFYPAGTFYDISFLGQNPIWRGFYRGTIYWAPSDCQKLTYSRTSDRLQHWNCSPDTKPFEYAPWPANRNGQFVGNCSPIWRAP